MLEDDLIIKEINMKIKKILSEIISVSLVFSLFVPSVSANSSLGDINADGIVDISDLSELSLVLIGDKTFTDDQLKAADINENGKADLADLAILKQYLSKVIDSLENKKNDSEPEPDYYSFDVRSILKYNELKDSMKMNDDELNKYLESIPGGIHNRSSVNNFINIVDTHPVLDFITGTVTWLNYSKGVSVDSKKPYEILHITVTAENDEWIRYEYLFSSSQSEQNYYGFADAEVTVFAPPLVSDDGNTEIFAQTVREHPSGTGSIITLYTNINDTTVRMNYFAKDSEAFDINYLLSSSLVYIKDING